MTREPVPMKKLLNSAERIVAGSLAGLAVAHGDLVRVDAASRIVVLAGGPTPGKVGLVSGGGSDHEPLHTGFVGYGMLDAAWSRGGLHLTRPRSDRSRLQGQALNRARRGRARRTRRHHRASTRSAARARSGGQHP
jgi:dihydroxyacetone kinase-like protein